MNTETKIQTSDESWETGTLGRDEASVRRTPDSENKSVDDALDLQMISIRLHKELLEQLKFIANYHVVGYQPLIRDVLARWARSEMLTIAEQMRKDLEAEETIRASALKRA